MSSSVQLPLLIVHNILCNLILHKHCHLINVINLLLSLYSFLAHIGQWSYRILVLTWWCILRTTLNALRLLSCCHITFNVIVSRDLTTNDRELSSATHVPCRS